MMPLGGALSLNATNEKRPSLTLSTKQLFVQLKLHADINDCVDPKWVTANYAWHRGIAVGCASLLDCLRWQWWSRHGSQDLIGAYKELADIWYFILSYTLARKQGDRLTAQVSIQQQLEDNQLYVFVGYAPADASTFDVYKCIDVFMSLAAGGVVSLPLFNRIRHLLNLSWTELHALYMAKDLSSIHPNH